MLSQNFTETVQNAMNEIAETNRNIGLLEQSITMQAFSAVALETQADAAEMMIRDEESRKESIIEHLFELHAECLERMQEVNELIKSANDEHEFYLKEERENIEIGDMESAEICQTLKAKAFESSTAYHKDWKNLHELSKQILATIAGESSPRLLSVATTSDLPFESTAQPAEDVDVMATFDRLVKAHPAEVIDYVVRHRDIRAENPEKEIQDVIAVITGGRISAEDALQSLAEVLDPKFSAFYERLNEQYAINPKPFQKELAECIEAYC